MDLIYVYCQRWYVADNFPQFIGNFELFLFFFRQKRAIVVIIKSVKNNLFSICDGNQPYQIFQGLMNVDFLCVWIFDPVTFVCGFLLIKNLKLDKAFQLGGRRFRNNPRRVKFLNMLETRYD